VHAFVQRGDAAGQAETGENQKDSDGFMPYVRRGQRADPETVRDGGDARRMAHNPATATVRWRGHQSGRSCH